MDLLLDETNPYSIEDLWEPTYLSTRSFPTLETFTWDQAFPDLARGIFKKPANLFDNNESNVFQLDVFDLELLDPISDGETLPSSSASQIDGGREEKEKAPEEIEHIWTLESLSQPPSNVGILRSWDTFPNCDARDPAPAYLSEAGPRGFDAALSHHATDTGLENSGRVARSDAFIAALFKLGLGWNSIFFRFNEQTRKFEKDMKDVRVSGISLPAVDGLIEEILQCGTQVRSLRRFILAVPMATDTPTPISSLAHSISVLLDSLDQGILERCKLNPTLLQTQMLFRRASCLLSSLVALVKNFKNDMTDGEVISMVFTTCDHYAHQFVWLADILHEVTTRVAEPWCSLVESWIGLRPEPPTLIELSGNGRGFIDINYVSNATSNRHDVDLVFHSQAMPIFVPADHVQTIFESGKSLRLLKTFHPKHPLIRRNQVNNSISLSLQSSITWDDIDRIQQKANQYESILRTEILRYNAVNKKRSNTVSEESFPSPRLQKDLISIDNVFDLFNIEENGEEVNLLPGRSPNYPSRLATLLSETQCFNLEKSPMGESRFGPPLSSSVYLSLSPVISAQTRLVNFSCLHLLFKGHKIREHLQLQWRFQLLGDGIFSSMLSHILFDPNMQSSERKRGVMRGNYTGLRLGSRDTWPPASSELRLVLSGLLSECYDGGTLDTATARQLPGGLSFSIRELTGQELLRCKDPNSIAALDFLRLQYHAPTVLEAVITPKSLHKYDHLFKHLLRLTRMLAVVHGLVHDSKTRTRNRYTNLPRRPSNLSLVHKFRFEAQHFVQSFSEYCFHIGVGDTWTRFSKTLLKIERCIDAGDIDGTMEHARGLHLLREYHEDVLDQILFALFLSKKHAAASKLVEDIFETILSFAQVSKVIASARDDSDTATTAAADENADAKSRSNHHYDRMLGKLYTVFRKQVGGFVRFLRALDGVKARRSKGKHLDLAAWGSGSAAEAGMETESVFEHLLLRLDLTEYY
ncbi:hypothetical protein AJ80_07097 [Polytolypa hystricis UAMH7299]|uniref:Spindle pole body component n=1 Tax=Polytolypa hystricis (strain UAMH7299) TaxID=1447883 RepID=A0A2B7XRY8_POLH7|nr:hypothetical protein AJ80_07097 [Polytolypa hystricis UAMH7299]